MGNRASAALAAAVLTIALTTAPSAAADDPAECEVDGTGAYCIPAPPACEDYAAVYLAQITQAERRAARAERRIERKNATIKRLRAALAAAR